MGDRMFVAMAGFHQIWVMDIKEGMIQPFAGNGRETLTDGPLAQSCFAQPSGLSSDGKSLFVADSETSSVRSIGLDAKGAVTTLAGSGLFNFGDQDGVEGKVLLQHALGVAWSGKQLFVADTYNSKIKVIDPATRSCSTFMTGFKEPAGIWYAAGKLYVANTNAHEIVEITIDSKAKRVVEFKGLSSR
jgi:DNA-binding beta-propeller fold protein YncE